MCSDQQRDRIGPYPPGDEAQALSGLLIDPLGVVDHDERRSLSGQAGDQRQDGGADQEPVGRLPAHPECRAQGSGLRRRKRLQPVAHRPQQFVQRREGETRLHPGAPAAQHRRLSSCVDGVIQQGGLADSRLTPQDQPTPRAAGCLCQQPVQGRGLGPPPEQVHDSESSRSATRPIH